MLLANHNKWQKTLNLYSVKCKDLNDNKSKSISSLCDEFSSSTVPFCYNQSSKTTKKASKQTNKQTTGADQNNYSTVISIRGKMM